MSSFQVGKTERFAGIVVKQLNVFSTRNGNNNELRALRSTGEVLQEQRISWSSAEHELGMMSPPTFQAAG